MSSSPPYGSVRRKRSESNRSSGFTLLEVTVVLAIIGVIAAMSFVALRGLRERAALAGAPKQLLAALSTAKAAAASTGRESLLVVLGNEGPAQATRCGQGGNPMDDARCVRYWILADVVDATSARFDDAALADFDPLRPTALGDRLLDSGALPRGVFIGRGPAFVAPPIPATSVFKGLPLTRDCSFCMALVPARGVIRFSPRGTARVGADSSAPGGVLFLNIAHSTGEPVEGTRAIAILQPAGLVTDRLHPSL